jgi:hypothetical protein
MTVTDVTFEPAAHSMAVLRFNALTKDGEIKPDENVIADAMQIAGPNIHFVVNWTCAYRSACKESMEYLAEACKCTLVEYTLIQRGNRSPLRRDDMIAISDRNLATMKQKEKENNQ